MSSQVSSFSATLTGTPNRILTPGRRLLTQKREQGRQPVEQDNNVHHRPAPRSAGNAGEPAGQPQRNLTHRRDRVDHHYASDVEQKMHESDDDTGLSVGA